MAKSAQQKASQKQEKKIAKLCGGRVQVASGALDGAKGDVRNLQFLIECKTTTKYKYDLKKTVWDKIETEAIKDGWRIPVMQIDIMDKSCLIMDFHIYIDFFQEDEKCGEWIPVECSDKQITILDTVINFMERKDFPVMKFCAFKREYAIMLLDKYIHKLKGEC